MNYIQEHFHFPLFVFRKKIEYAFDDCTDIRLNDMIRLKFDTAVRKTKEFIESELRASKYSSLIICQNNYI